jgi:hypothetical protein
VDIEGCGEPRCEESADEGEGEKEEDGWPRDGDTETVTAGAEGIDAAEADW